MPKASNPFLSTLHALVEIDRQISDCRDTARIAAREEIWEGTITPPSDLIAPAFLPEAGAPIMEETARNVVSWGVAYIARREAEAALWAMQIYYPRKLSEHRAAGWKDQEVHHAYGETERMRDAYMRAKAKAKRAKA
jgi:hypothetical protein